jgi:hypothetical protein
MSLDLDPHSELDKSLRIGIILILFIWNVLVATRMETAYPEVLVEIYALPATRLLLLGGVLGLSFWCPTVTVVAALAYICLGADVIFLTK